MGVAASSDKGKRQPEKRDRSDSKMDSDKNENFVGGFEDDFEGEFDDDAHIIRKDVLDKHTSTSNRETGPSSNTVTKPSTTTGETATIAATSTESTELALKRKRVSRKTTSSFSNSSAAASTTENATTNASLTGPTGEANEGTGTATAVGTVANNNHVQKQRQEKPTTGKDRAITEDSKEGEISQPKDAPQAKKQKMTEKEGGNVGNKMVVASAEEDTTTPSHEPTEHGNAYTVVDTTAPNKGSNGVCDAIGPTTDGSAGNHNSVTTTRNPNKEQKKNDGRRVATEAPGVGGSRTGQDKDGAHQDEESNGDGGDKMKNRSSNDGDNDDAATASKAATQSADVDMDAAAAEAVDTPQENRHPSPEALEINLNSEGEEEEDDADPLSDEESGSNNVPQVSHETDQEGEHTSPPPDKDTVGAPDTRSDDELTSLSSRSDESPMRQNVKLEDDVEEVNCEVAQQLDTSSLKDVKEVLDAIKCPRALFDRGEATDMPGFPNLQAGAFGVIPLPLTPLVTKAASSKLTTRPHRSSSHRQSRDRTPPAPVEVSASVVTMGNPKWDNAVERLANHLVKKLNLQVNSVNTQLEKVLLWGEQNALPQGEEGEEHETEQQQNMEEVAKLIVQLPSNFTGGSLLLNSEGYEADCSLSSGSEAMLGYRYLFHLPNCNLSSQQLETGVRLTLHYTVVPSAEISRGDYSDRREDLAELESVLAALPAPRSLFIYPLEFDYQSDADVVKSSLLLKDEIVEKSIQTNGRGEWDTLLGTLVVKPNPKKDSSCEQKRLTIQASKKKENDIFVRAIESLTSFHSYDDDGIVLLPRDKMKEAVQQLTGQQQLEPRIGKPVRLLIAFRKSSEFELLCHHHFPSAVSKVASDPTLLGELFSFLRKAQEEATAQMQISSNDAAGILRLLALNSHQSSDIHEDLRITLECTEKDRKMSEELVMSLLQIVAKLGWTAVTEPIKAYLAGLVTQFNGQSIAEFTSLFDIFLSFRREAPCTFVDEMIQNVESSFEDATNSSRFDNEEASDMKSTVDNMVEALIALRHFGWGTIQPMVIYCFQRLRKITQTPQVLLHRLEALNRLCRDGVKRDMETVKEAIVDDVLRPMSLVRTLRPPPPPSRDSNSTNDNNDNPNENNDAGIPPPVGTATTTTTSAAPTTMLSYSDIQPLMPQLVHDIKEYSWPQVEAWVSAATIVECSQIQRHVARIQLQFKKENDSAQIEFIPPVDDLGKVVLQRIKKVLLAKIKAEHQLTQEELKLRKPKKDPSWKMPGSGPFKKFNKFLISSKESGFEFTPKSESQKKKFELHVGGVKDVIQRGFSVAGRIKDGSFQLEKTNQLNKALRKRYREERDACKKFDPQLQEFDGSAGGSSKKHKYNHYKKSSTGSRKAIPENVEIIEIL